ncbi:hypothetical protein NBRC10512v2_000971 [Rhodotorula toruloides]
MTTNKPFDAPLASTLLPSLVKLSQLAADASSVGASNGEAGDAAGETDGARSAKVEISKQAASLRTKLATLSAQAAALPAGDLSLDDQAEELHKMALLTALSAEKGKETMDTAP